MNQRAKLRPWQFSLRFLLAMTALVAVGAAFFGWRARQLEPQRRAVARIVELGGSVEIERCGWIEAIVHACDFEEVIGVTLPGHLTDLAIPDLSVLPRLRHVTMSYSTLVGGGGGFGGLDYWYSFDLGGESIKPSDERPRFTRIKEQFPDLEIDVSHNGVVVPIETAFLDSRHFGWR